MKFMILVKANKESEARELPSDECLKKMGKFNDELIKAGVMLAGAGLQPSSKGVRVKFSEKEPTVTDGPFTETKELVAGYWLWNCDSLQDAIQWLKRAPFSDAEVEIRPLFEMEDFCKNHQPELHAQAVEHQCA